MAMKRDDWKFEEKLLYKNKQGKNKANTTVTMAARVKTSLNTLRK